MVELRCSQQLSPSSGTTLAAHTVCGVTDIAIVFGMMTDLSSMMRSTASRPYAWRFGEAHTKGGVHGSAVRRPVEGTS